MSSKLQMMPGTEGKITTHKHDKRYNSFVEKNPRRTWKKLFNQASISLLVLRFDVRGNEVARHNETE